MKLEKTKVFVEYEGVKISEDISKYLLGFTYIDNVHGKADEVTLTLDDSGGLFQNEWYPDKKSLIKCSIEHEGRTLDCGSFYIDEISVSGPPDVVTWKATSIDPNSSLRTKKSKSFNELTLLKIAKDIAEKHNLTLDDGTKTITLQKPPTLSEQAKLVKLAELFLLYSNEKNAVFFYNQMSALQNELLKVIQALEAKGYATEAAELRTGIGENLYDKTQTDVPTDSRNKRLGASKMSSLCTKVKAELRVEPTVQTRTLGLGLSKIFVKQSTQNNESDLEYLARISAKYGLAFNIKPPKMIFYSKFHLEDSPSALVIDKSQLTAHDLTDKIHGTYSDVDVKSHNPNTNETVSNSTELQNTATEQAQLQYLFNYISKAATFEYAQRLAFIRKAGETNDKLLVSYTQKGLGDQYDGLIAAYALLYADKSVEACVRYANFCKDQRAGLLKLQTSGNKVTKDKDAYSGGQSSNTLVVRTKAEDKEQADAIGKAALHTANSETRSGSFSFPGNILALAGNNFEYTGGGRLSGKYNIISSTHEISSEYTTSIEFKAGAIVVKSGKTGKVSVS